MANLWTWQILLLLPLPTMEGTDAECLASLNSKLVRLRDLSAVMAQDHNWDILHRRGEATICLQENHRFFFALLFYQQWPAPAATSDFGVCLPQECGPMLLTEDVLPKMYHYFFDSHVQFSPDGSIDSTRSLQYSITVKEYKSTLSLSSDLHWQIATLMFAAFPCVAVTLWEVLRFRRIQQAVPSQKELCEGMEGMEGKGLKAPLLVKAFSFSRACQELVSVPEGVEFAGDLCWMRFAYVCALITLHVTQGAKWRHIEVLESSYTIFRVVRPLALVNDAFIQLSAYLCACSSLKAMRGGDESTFTRLRAALLRAWRKYLRQLPVCLFWNWFYLYVLPSIPYNPYNHAFPWFGIRWYHATGKCMNRKWRYSFLLGDVGALLFGGDTDWYSTNGNPCVNLWNFQLEIQAFTLTTCILALGRSTALSIFFVIVALGFGSSTHVDTWWVHHARGIAIQMIVLCGFGLASRPLSAKWRNLRWLGSFFFIIACVIHGISRGGWAEKIQLNEFNQLLVTGLWQAALALGTALLCEGCRAGTSNPSSALAAFNRLAFGINVAHPFVQFFIEAHTTLNDRVFSLFSWPCQLALVFALTALPAMLVYIFVQRPWALILQHVSDVGIVCINRRLSKATKQKGSAGEMARVPAVDCCFLFDCRIPVGLRVRGSWPPNTFTLYKRIDLPQAQLVKSSAANLKLNPALDEAGSTQRFAGSTLRSQTLRPRVWAPTPWGQIRIKTLSGRHDTFRGVFRSTSNTKKQIEYDKHI